MLSELMAHPDSIQKLVANLRLLGDPTRLRLLGLLEAGERNVSSLCGVLDLAQPTVSHHLGLMREAGLVVSRRQGKQVFYRLNEETISSRPNHDTASIETEGLSISVSRLRPAAEVPVERGHGAVATVTTITPEPARREPVPMARFG